MNSSWKSRRIIVICFLKIFLIHADFVSRNCKSRSILYKFEFQSRADFWDVNVNNSLSFFQNAVVLNKFVIDHDIEFLQFFNKFHVCDSLLFFCFVFLKQFFHLACVVAVSFENFIRVILIRLIDLSHICSIIFMNNNNLIEINRILVLHLNLIIFVMIWQLSFDLCMRFCDFDFLDNVFASQYCFCKCVWFFDASLNNDLIFKIFDQKCFDIWRNNKINHVVVSSICWIRNSDFTKRYYQNLFNDNWEKFETFA